MARDTFRLNNPINEAGGIIAQNLETFNSVRSKLPSNNDHNLAYFKGSRGLSPTDSFKNISGSRTCCIDS